MHQSQHGIFGGDERGWSLCSPIYRTVGDDIDIYIYIDMIYE